MKFIKAFAVDNQAYYINIAHIVSVSKTGEGCNIQTLVTVISCKDDYDGIIKLINNSLSL